MRPARARALARRHGAGVVLGDHRDQSVDDVGIELRASSPEDLFEGGLVADTAPVRTIGGDRDEGVTRGDHPARLRDLLTRLAVRVPAAVPALVM